MKKRLLTIATVILVNITVLSSHPQAQDMDAMMKWSRADVIKYHNVGVYSAKTDVIAGIDIGYADVTDRVVIDLTWKLSEGKLVGTPAITNEKSVLKNLTNAEPKCNPPVLRGEYEHFTLLSIKPGPAGDYLMQVQQVYPPATVIQVCSGAPKQVAGETETESREFGVASPMILAMPAPGGNITIAPDKKSFSVKDNKGWTWTYTPSL